MKLSHWLPCIDWGRRYNRSSAAQDALAAVIVTLMLIPQSLAYAQLAGLPPYYGLYAAFLPVAVAAITNWATENPSADQNQIIFAMKKDWWW